MKKEYVKFLSIATVAALTAGVLTIFLLKDKNPIVKHIVSFNVDGGTPIESIEVEHGKKITEKIETYKDGYYVKNWLNNNNPWIFEKDIVNSDIELTANWDIATYSIIYDFNGGEPIPMPTNYNINSNFELPRPTYSSMVFGGWFDQNNNRVDHIKPNTIFGDLQLTAKWLDKLIVISDDESKGTIKVYSSEEDPTKITLVNSPVNNKYHLFKAWLNADGDVLSEDPEFITTLDDNVSLEIHSSYFNEDEEAEWNIAHGVEPIIEGNPNRVIYGMYPQSHVSDTALIETLNQLPQTSYNGYTYFNHEYYLNKTSILARDLNTHDLLSIREFDDGYEFEEDEQYWFKVEPLSWKIIKQTSNTYTLLSEELLDVQRYYRNSVIRIVDEETIYSNNYEYSDIRKWLNNSFVNNAFAFDKNHLTIMEIDNSKDTTATPDSGFDCENTYDYVTILSYGELDLLEVKDRQIKTTDFVRVCGANYSVNENNLFSGYYWTRSPIESEEEDKNGTAASRCNMNGALNSDYVGWGGSCVQPVIQIKVG